MSETHDGAGVPLGEPPPAVLAARERLKAAMTQDPAPGKPARQKGSAPRVAPRVFPDPDPEEHLAEEEQAPEPAPKGKTVKWNPKPLKLEYELISFSFEIEVLSFHNGGQFITVLFGPAFNIGQPSQVCQLKLTYGGRDYLVEHMGINFEIPELGVKGVSFLVSDDKARQS